MDFTLFLNSRGRVEQLEKCIIAAEQATTNCENVEFIITADDDDLETVDFLNSLGSRKTFNFKTIIGPRLNNLIKSFNNMALQAKGRYLFVLNDDSEIKTKGWNSIALARIQEYKQKNNIKDDVVYCATTDNSVDKIAGKGYASFPIISSEAVRVLGFFMYEEFVGLGGDSSIFRVYKEVERVVHVPEIELDHLYHNNFFSVISPDLTAYEMRANSNRHHVDPFSFDISDGVERLRRFIKGNRV